MLELELELWSEAGEERNERAKSKDRVHAISTCRLPRVTKFNYTWEEPRGAIET